jgi:hypothetical protein
VRDSSPDRTRTSHKAVEQLKRILGISLLDPNRRWKYNAKIEPNAQMRRTRHHDFGRANEAMIFEEEARPNGCFAQMLPASVRGVPIIPPLEIAATIYTGSLPKVARRHADLLLA